MQHNITQAGTSLYTVRQLQQLEVRHIFYHSQYRIFLDKRGEEGAGAEDEHYRNDNYRGLHNRFGKQSNQRA
ncbi:hypothetical protein D3C80_2074980 [compost metagenome]